MPMTAASSRTSGGNGFVGARHVWHLRRGRVLRWSLCSGSALQVLRGPSGEGAALLAVELVGGVGQRGDGGLDRQGFCVGLGLGFLDGFGGGGGFGAVFYFTGEAGEFFAGGDEGGELFGGGYGQGCAVVGGGKDGILIALGEDEGEEVGVQAESNKYGERHATLGEVFEDGAAVAEDLPPFGFGHLGFAAGQGADVHGAGPFWGWLYVPILSVRALHWGERADHDEHEGTRRAQRGRRCTRMSCQQY